MDNMYQISLRTARWWRDVHNDILLFLAILNLTFPGLHYVHMHELRVLGSMIFASFVLNPLTDRLKRLGNNGSEDSRKCLSLLHPHNSHKRHRNLIIFATFVGAAIQNPYVLNLFCYITYIYGQIKLYLQSPTRTCRGFIPSSFWYLWHLWSLHGIHLQPAGANPNTSV